MIPLIEFKSLSKRFGNHKVVEGVSFKLNKGEITTLIGQNGVGKTTLAKIILGLEPYDSGELIIAKDLRIGYVPQSLDLSFAIPITVKGLLEILSQHKTISKDFALSYFLDFEEIKNKDISEISGGQLQKVLLAGTIMSKPDLIILDEPTQYLDVASQQEFYKTLVELKNKFGITIFMISHDLFTVMKNSDQVICLNGHVCCSGKPTDIDSNSDFKNALSEIGVYIHTHDHKH
ncbi:putative metal ABC transporter ATP-binding protein [Candidatus Megaera venefica]|uniref:Metal ABC transporter ATP-binding protein n=1 Tax=Candidatus Megaera venefica TaxID=2055910 RepID=A0ABU5NC01_9RICK|nr:metal ABC transporter ATP-binding protein [Candidatus Megaera venefica]MEA0970657.1 putative metal ABC transporter ATP-binding protein [Candidatus Megaera venefica]